MKIKFDAAVGKWNYEVADMLPKHDLVFLSPVCDPTYGLPIGDGDTGCLLSLRENSLVLNINKSDIVDKSTDRNSVYGSSKEEDLTVLRHGAQLEFDFGCPIFETIYQKQFEARLSLADATAHIKAETAFGSTEIKAFASHNNSVTVLQVAFDADDTTATSLSLERWGSRTFWYWYLQFKDIPEKGLDGTDSGFADGVCHITQHLNGTDFCVALKADISEKNSFERSGKHRVNCRIKPTKNFSATFYISVCTGKNTDEAKEKAIAKVNAAYGVGKEKLYIDHRKEWRTFWNKSFVCLPNELNYIENLWYLNLYYANSQMRGKHPAHFCNGLWSFYHDFVPWSNFFHYNMQLSTFPLEAANHSELLETYYNFRFNQLEGAKKYSQSILGGKGVFYTDVCDCEGRNLNIFDLNTNCTCAAQIALSLYKHSQYSGDKNYLNEKALPLLKSVGEFYLDRLVAEDDGLYHIHKTQGYEGSLVLDDSITDLSMIRCVFAVLIKELPENERGEYIEKLDKLVPFTEVPFDGDELSDGKLAFGIGKGKTPFSDKVLSVGKEVESGEPLRKTYGNYKKATYGFPDTEMSPLHPAEIVGLKDKDSDLFKMIQNSVYLHCQTIPRSQDGMCMGWCMMPIYLSRLGMADELFVQLFQTVDTWLIFPQGFGIYGPYDEANGYNNMRWQRNSVRNVENDEKSSAPAWNFRHFDYETLPIIASAVNEMLMQSFDGVIRLFPAIKKESDVQFKLAAVGGFIVNSSYCCGEYSVDIESLRGGECRVALPLRKDEPIFGSPAKSVDKDGVYLFETNVGEILHIQTAHYTEGLCFDRSFKSNCSFKRLGGSKLGTEKSF